ncbi:right-handed parallel beta-helix repeat-containing protein [Pedobacter jamesrossensis]|uniref:Right-handed parallel beta-helix repeat-containing protein n=1 Tax=Pedobacter jamesrossensis TaxID=1908238 RepID=A0ABV8NS69_9SPHI
MKKIYPVIFVLLYLFSIYGCKKDDSTIIEPPVVTSPVVANPSAYSRTFYVAVNGNDNNTLTQAKNPTTPWKTIQKAANSITGGDTVMISGGIYIEKVVLNSTVSGTLAKPTLFRNKPGEAVIIDGQNSGNRFESLFRLNTVDHVTIKGLKSQNASWYGFSAITSNNITYDSCYTENTGASGIHIAQSTYVNILRNNIKKACQVQTRDAVGNGTQECITLGRTSNFKVSLNEIYDVALVGEGGEGIDPKGSCFDGEISNNYCHDLARVGIYMDASSGSFGDTRNIRVFNNRVFRCGGGISVAGELGGHIREIYIYNNVLFNNTNSGVLFQSIGNGRYSDIYIINNTLINNGSAGFAGDISNFSQNALNANIQIKNNIFYNKTSNYRFSIFHNIAAPHVISSNLYFDFKPGFAGGVNNFSTSNLTTVDLQADPLFNDFTNNNFTLKSTSPAINKGVVVTLPSSSIPLFTTDFNGKSKGTNNWDMGAFEF